MNPYIRCVLSEYILKIKHIFTLEN